MRDHERLPPSIAQPSCPPSPCPPRQSQGCSARTDLSSAAPHHRVKDKGENQVSELFLETACAEGSHGHQTLPEERDCWARMLVL